MVQVFSSIPDWGNKSREKMNVCIAFLEIGSVGGNWLVAWFEQELSEGSERGWYAER